MRRKAGRPPKYHTMEERRAAKKLYNRRYQDKRRRGVGSPVCRIKDGERAKRAIPLPPAPPSSPLPPSSPPSSFDFEYSPTELFLDISTPAGIRVQQRFREAIRRCRQRKAARLGASASRSIPTEAVSKEMAPLPSSASSISPPKIFQPYKEKQPKAASRFVQVESDSDIPDALKRARESTPDDDCTLPVVSSDVCSPF
ncbi:hypothetical protein K435DRAFT_862423 [Dendrothele bispora CBS 962.96]|uniref:Uncharacterized protein n=1 Tax=Dendrothele bispora (strain CBS 962.96) TaxID=1314807 RepID=A0A4S8LSM2_DENBC|nr:hypothetical protein K435DRAFT_862423 [Dendrothele bispora CBS 962.96]